MKIEAGSELKGNREIKRFNAHDVVVVVPDKHIKYKDGFEQMRKLLDSLK